MSTNGEAGFDTERDREPVWAGLAALYRDTSYLTGNGPRYGSRLGSRGMAMVGEQLRSWRERRHVSQLDLSLQAGISARHLSFVETGRSKPSSGLILRLSEELDVPLRERNVLLLAGGFAPAYPEHGLDAPPLSAVTEAMRQVITAHMPNPALAVDGHWELIDANDAVSLLTEGTAAELMEPPVNVLRVSLHPDGMAPRIRQPGAVATARAVPAAPPGRPERRPVPSRAVRGTQRLSRWCWCE